MKEHEALLSQARSDFQLFEFLRDQNRTMVPECHALHFLQMSTEKLAKAVFIALDQSVGVRYSHVAFSHIPHHLSRADIARKLGWKDFRHYRAFLRRTAPLFREIDELNPSVGPQQPGGGPKEGPNVEYPWPTRDSTGNAMWEAPVDHDFMLLERLRQGTEGAALLGFVRTLLERFDTVVR